MKVEGYNGSSQMTPDERLGLLSLLPRVGTLYEVGTWQGVTAAWLADRRPALEIVSIDPMRVHEGNQRYSNRTDTARVAAYNALRRPNQRLIQTIAEKSGLPPASADVILIDGCHTAEWVTRDLAWAARAIKPGGAILVHDFSDDWPGVVSATRLFAEAAAYAIIVVADRLVQLVSGARTGPPRENTAAAYHMAHKQAGFSMAGLSALHKRNRNRRPGGQRSPSNVLAAPRFFSAFPRARANGLILTAFKAVLAVAVLTSLSVRYQPSTTSTGACTNSNASTAVPLSYVVPAVLQLTPSRYPLAMNWYRPDFFDVCAFKNIPNERNQTLTSHNRTATTL